MTCCRRSSASTAILPYSRQRGSVLQSGALWRTQRHALTRGVIWHRYRRESSMYMVPLLIDAKPIDAKPVAGTGFTTGHFIETILKWTFKRLSLIVYSMLREKPEEKEHAMSDNIHRYRAIREALIQGYPGELHGRSVRHLTTLAALISGIVGGKSTQLPHIATKVPDGTKPESRVKRFTRWLDNDRILEEVYFLPYAALFLTH